MLPDCIHVVSNIEGTMYHIKVMRGYCVPQHLQLFESQTQSHRIPAWREIWKIKFDVQRVVDVGDMIFIHGSDSIHCIRTGGCPIPGPPKGDETGNLTSKFDLISKSLWRNFFRCLYGNRECHNNVISFSINKVWYDLGNHNSKNLSEHEIFKWHFS